MRIIVLTLLALVISACAGKPLDPYHEAEFAAIINEFEQTCGKKVKSTVMFSEYLEEPAVGVCYMGAYAVFISLDYWMHGSTAAERFNLIMHELGHCDLHRDHKPDLTVMEIDGVNQVVPESIMYPYVFTIPDYPGIKDYYMKELCGN